MRAFKEMKEELETPLQTVGHIPGFRAGDAFRCKGELAIVGIHCNIAGGIYFGYTLTAWPLQCNLSAMQKVRRLQRWLGHMTVKLFAMVNGHEAGSCRNCGPMRAMCHLADDRSWGLCRQLNPCFAIVLSGGYKDDEDAGAEILYTGMGGQKDGRQVSDESHPCANHALQDGS